MYGMLEIVDCTILINSFVRMEQKSYTPFHL